MPSRIRVSAARAGRLWYLLVLTSGGFRVDLSGYTLLRQSTELSPSYPAVTCPVLRLRSTGNLVFHARFWTLFPKEVLRVQYAWFDSRYSLCASRGGS